MAIDPDLLIDRRRLRRRLALWRAAAVVAALGAVAAVVGQGGAWHGERVARLNVVGVILSDPERDAALDALAEDDDVKALIISIDSPGGTFVGGESLHDALLRVRERKPVVAVMNDLAASGGYMAAVAAERVFARRGTLTGSIGVLWETFDASALLDTIGIGAEMLTSGPLKGQPSPTEPLSDPARVAIQGLVDEMHGLFVDMVVAGRGLDEARVRQLADGRVYSGQQAVVFGLVDAIGGEREARAWLAEAKGIDADLPISDVDFGDDPGGWFEKAFGFSGKTLLSETLTLDGLLALWHPSRP